MKAKGDCPKGPLRSDGSQDSQGGRLDCISGSQSHSKTKLSLRGGHQARVHSDHMVLMMARWEAGPH
jgi:hypothetical protein